MNGAAFNIGDVLVLDGQPALDADGARLHGLAVGDPEPWTTIVVRGVIATSAGVEFIASPLVFSAAASPRQISAQALLETGFRVATPGAPQGTWVTDAAELAKASA